MDDLDRVFQLIDQRFRSLESGMPKLRKGVITDVSPLSVSIGGAEDAHVGARSLNGDSFSVDDQVSVLTCGGLLIVLGVLT